MLILSRRVGERFIISDDIVVTVLGISGGQVKLGIDAPADKTILREEIYQRLCKEKAQSTNLDK